MRFLFGILLCSLLAYGCSEKDHLASAYDDGWSAEAPKSKDKKYTEDYSMGQEDAATYDEGFDQGFEKRVPQYKKDSMYMMGYEDGKEARKRRGY